MAYCTVADLKKAIPERNLVQVTDDENVGTINEPRVVQAIADADDLIDTYLRGKHTVPLTTVPAIIRRHSVILALYYLYQRRMEISVSESMDAQYKAAIRFLEGVRDGKNIIDDAESPATTGGVFKTNKTSCDREYTPARLDQF